MDNKLHEFKTDAIAVTWSRARCIHAAACVQGLPEVFEPGQRPWVMPANAAPDQVAAVVKRCPTGALHFQRADGGAPEGIPERNWGMVSRSGPLFMKGDLRLMSAEGREVLRDTRVALCRCGASKNKPFCDNSHWEVRFRDAGTLPEGGLKGGGADPDAPARGPVTITPLANGPLQLIGEIELLSGDGQSRQRGMTTRLCRCGQSNNKPFCDGSHTVVGFVAEPLA